MRTFSPGNNWTPHPEIIEKVSPHPEIIEKVSG